MANRFFGLNKGVVDKTTPVTTGTSTGGTDVELRVTTTAATLTKNDIFKILDRIKEDILENDVVFEGE